MEWQFQTLVEVVTWIAAGGGAMVVAGYVVAYFLANLPFFQNLPRWVKLITPIVLAGLLAVGAQSVLTLGLLDMVPPQVQALLLLLIGWLASQKAYRGIKSDPEYAKLDGAPKG